MQVIPFIAESAADAVAQIRAQLGSEAVVLHVRQLPVHGLSRLWKSPRIEVLACRPEDQRLAANTGVGVASGSSERTAAPASIAPSSQPVVLAEPKPMDGGQSATRGGSGGEPAPEDRASHWRIAGLLETSGLLLKHAHCVVDALKAQHGEKPPATLAQELGLARSALKSLWPALPNTGQSDRGPHVLVGPAGVGKTTCLCKWLTQARLMEGRSVQVWRLDGMGANTAEWLSVYCEILGVTPERTWSSADASLNSDLGLIDLPGVDWPNPRALRVLGRQLDEMGPARIHLVLNAAYEVPVLLAQARAFAGLPVEDLIFTHLDEERRWGKIWNVVLGTKLPVRFLSAAQNIPGEFSTATAEKILSRQFPA